MEKDLAQDIFLPLHPEQLIGANGLFAIPHGQIICYHTPWDAYVITHISPEKEYTIAHYELLPENAPFQLLQSKLCFMPTPNLKHQRISGHISREIDLHISTHKLGELFYARVDVEFNENSIAQPDLLFISNQRKDIAKEDAMRIVGAPDFIVEILSSNEFDDRVRKMELYGEHDVLEYWIVDPKAEAVEVYHNVNRKLELVRTAQKDETIDSKVIEGFSLELGRIFAW